MLNEDDLFSPITLNDQIYYDDSMPPICDDYCDDTYAIKSSDDYIYKTCHDYDYPFLNITLLMWKQFLVFKSFMILPFF